MNSRQIKTAGSHMYRCKSNFVEGLSSRMNDNSASQKRGHCDGSSSLPKARSHETVVDRNCNFIAQKW